uniref:Uncharacterized protein n=1 Tax=Parascaris equorum TaxID=6256 RepID=A0A914RMP4_PAREQ
MVEALHQMEIGVQLVIRLSGQISTRIIRRVVPMQHRRVAMRRCQNG